jgi:hypothetical protein
MNATEVLTTLGIPAAAEVLAAHWEESAALLPAECPRFLDPENISRTRAFALLPEEVDPPLHEAARRITSSPQLLQLAWHCHRLLYEHLDYEAGVGIRQWPHPIPALGDLSGAFYLLIALDAVPRMRAVHQQLGVSRTISRASCTHYPEWLRIYQEQHNGQCGFLTRTLYWLRNYTRGDLYRLGRFEYMVKPFKGGLAAYRHRQTRAVVALAAAGTRFDSMGFVAPAGQSESWCARLQERDGCATGSPISPRGYAENRQVALPLDEWARVLAPGDGILEVHIPAGGNMTPEHSRASMQQALEFFPRYLPERKFAGFACSSWILNPQLEQIYRPDSNMVLWQRELYLFPTPSGNRSGLYFVFGKDEIDIATAPRDTSLRRALLDHLEAGGSLISGGMFLLLEDLAHFGTQIYCRSSRPESR